MSSGRFGGLNRNEWGLAAAIVVVLALTTIVDPQHNYWHFPGVNAVDILRQAVMLGVFALGSAIVIISGGIDLSAGSMIAMGGTVCASILLILDPEGMKSPQVGLHTWVIVAAVAGTLVVGLLVGSLHAWLITVVGLPPFIATLATLVGLRSLARAVIASVTEAVLGPDGRSSQIQVFDQHFRYLAKSVWIPAALFVGLSIVFWIMLSRTPIGRHLYALGGNENAARLSGIRTERLKWLAYCIGATTSALAGVLFVGEQSVAAPENLGLGYELNSIAAAVVGGCSLQGGVGTIFGTGLGCFFFIIVMDCIAKIIKVDSDVYQGLIVGMVLVVAVAVNEMGRGRSGARQFFPGALGAVTVLNLSMLAGTVAFLIEGKNTALTTGVVTLAVLAIIKTVQGRRAMESLKT